MQVVTQTQRSSRRNSVKQPLAAADTPGAHLRIETVLALTGLSRSQWYRLIAEGVAPKPLRFGPRCSRWLSASVNGFLAERTAHGAKQ